MLPKKAATPMHTTYCSARLLILTVAAFALWIPGCYPEQEEPDVSSLFGEEPVSVTIPFVATDLQQNHRIGPQDIVLRECTADDLDGGEWPLDCVMADKAFVQGRVLRNPKLAGEPFLTTDLYLEGREPGAPPEPDDFREPAWPRPEYLRLLADVTSHSRKTSPRPNNDIAIPIAAHDLPEGRRIRVSDVALRVMSPQEIEENAYLQTEVMLMTEQFVGRRLVKIKQRGRPFLLSDFDVSDEVALYLERGSR